MTFNLKKILMYSIALSIFGALHAEESSRSFILSLQLPNTIKKYEGLKAYYKGYQIDLSEQWALLPECETPLTFSLLCIEPDDIDIKSHGNNIRYLKRKDHAEFLWYDLTLTMNPDEEHAYTWQIEKRDSSEIPARIPEHTIIMLGNPNFIESVQAEPALPSALNIALPKIIYKNEINPEKFHESLTCTTLAALNLDAIHKKEMPCCIRRNTVIISAASK